MNYCDQIISWHVTSPRSAEFGALGSEKGRRELYSKLRNMGKYQRESRRGWKSGTEAKLRARWAKIQLLVPYFLWGKKLNLVITLLFIWVHPYHPHPCQTQTLWGPVGSAMYLPPMPFRKQVRKNTVPVQTTLLPGEESGGERDRRSHRKQNCQSPSSLT